MREPIKVANDAGQHGTFFLSAAATGDAFLVHLLVDGSEPGDALFGPLPKAEAFARAEQYARAHGWTLVS